MAVNTRGIGNKLLLTPAIIANEALYRLRHQMMLTRLANRKFETYFANKIGDRISIKKPFYGLVQKGRVNTTDEPLYDESVDMVVNVRLHFLIKLIDETMTFDLLDFGNRYLKSFVEQMAYEVDIAGLKELGEGIFRSTLNPAGTEIRKGGITTDLAQEIRQFADEMAVPNDNQNYLMANPADLRDIAKDLKNTDSSGTISSIFDPSKVDDVIQRRYKGNLADWHIFTSTNLPRYHFTYPSGGLGTPLVNGGSQEGDTIKTNGWAATEQVILKRGAKITIAGVDECQPRGDYRKTGRRMVFTIAEDVSSTSAGAADLKIYPKLNAGTLTASAPDGTSISLKAYKNVTAAPADDAAINVLGRTSANAEYRQSLWYHKDALEFANIQLTKLDGLVNTYRSVDSLSGLSLLYSHAADITKMEDQRRCDVMFGVKTLYPELGFAHVGNAI